MKSNGAIIALIGSVVLSGCATGSAADRYGHLTRYCEPGSVIVKYAKDKPPPPARPASEHGTCKS